MRIVVLGSVALPVPPPMQGGTERVAHAQAVGLSKKGHEIMLIAAKGSQPSYQYQLVEIGGGDTVAGSFVLSSRPPSRDPEQEKDGFRVKPGMTQNTEPVESSRKLRKEMLSLSLVDFWLDVHASEYDCVLNNMRGGEVLFFETARRLGKKYANVMHLPMFADLADACRQLKIPLVSISNAQRVPFPDLNYVGTVYNGIDIADFLFEKNPDDYLLMMGSITPHKNQKTGISVAKSVGIKLVIAGKIGDASYYAKEIAPHVDGKTVIHHGEIGMSEKVRLYGKAKALLFPVLWEEPFGLVMIEAMACGTPVIAFRRGAVPEVVADGKTGFIVENESQMIEAVKKIDQIDRTTCRKHVEGHFTNDHMVESLEKVVTSL
ncbi:MAG: Glycosyl transferase group 1 [Parcubacteria group bacterium GW2011_GWA1_47_10]|nr:MAG: Glycosyl transferase group 1 [Parcubacteria group bacterium GW2011_GWA1_47_10]